MAKKVVAAYPDSYSCYKVLFDTGEERTFSASFAVASVSVNGQAVTVTGTGRNASVVIYFFDESGNPSSYKVVR
jgi:hypothetical protein